MLEVQLVPLDILEVPELQVRKVAESTTPTRTARDLKVSNAFYTPEMTEMHSVRAGFFCVSLIKAL